eukprot:TRINITY_DN2233_c1_g1_i2.p1 TRINITY_DN2233_c1_g1~~TRINITY_DN2233_c1_g1_i2.p1  ORF type:complete len:1722 (-),score=479.12 TRINITY_DN2233_c1_g1_i2:469-5391(-)
MVLQRAPQRANVWGWVPPYADVQVTLRGCSSRFGQPKSRRWPVFGCLHGLSSNSFNRRSSGCFTEMIMVLITFLATFLSLLMIAVAQIDPRNLVSNALGSNMVLQRAPQRANVWGWVPPYADVQVTLRDNAGAIVVQDSTRADFNGSWIYSLPPIPADLKPYSIQVVGGGKSSLMTNVLFGDIYIISGQSNCILGVGAMENATYERSLAVNYPNIRFWKGTRAPRFMDAPNPEFDKVDFNPPWVMGTASTIEGVSAVGWFFVRSLYDSLSPKVPLGLMTDCFATQLECYTTPQTLASCSYLNLFPCFGNIPDTTYGSKNLVFNSNIYPLLNLRNRGFIFYKGEGEVGREDVWECAINGMIKDYRAAWGYTDPSQWGFYWVMLHTWIADTDLAKMRLAMRSPRLLSDGNAYFVSAFDQGDPTGNIHPLKKVEVGRRLSLIVQNLNMGLPVYYKGPNVTGYQVLSAPGSANVTLELEFEEFSRGSGLVIQEGTSVCPAAFKPTSSAYCAGWQVADSYARWYTGRIYFVDATNTTVRFSATIPFGERVTGFRFGYGAWPLVDLYNNENLPVTPFVIQGPYNTTSPGKPVMSATTAVPPQPSCQRLDGWLQAYDMNLITNMLVPSVDACCSACYYSTKGCRSWSMLENMCFLMSTPFSYDGARQRPDTVSGWTDATASPSSSSGATTLSPSVITTRSSIPATSSVPTTASATTSVACSGSPRELYSVALSQSSTSNGWNYGRTVSRSGASVPVGMEQDAVTDDSTRTKDTVDVGLAFPAGSTSSVLYVWSNIRAKPVPINAVVTGIQVQLLRRGNSSGIRDLTVALVINGTVRPETNVCGETVSTCDWLVNPTDTKRFGGQTSTWNLPSSLLTPSILNAGFGAAIQSKNRGSADVEGRLDFVDYAVYYTCLVSTTSSSTTSTGTSSPVTTSTGTTSTGTTSTGTSSPVTTSTGTTSTGTTSTGTSSTGTTSTGTTSTGTTSTGTTSTGTTSPVTTSTGTPSTSTSSTGTTSTGTTSTGTTSTGTTAPGGTTNPAAPTPLSNTRYCKTSWQDSFTNGWNTNWTSASSPGWSLPLVPTADDTAKSKNGIVLHVTLAPGATSSTAFVGGYSNGVPLNSTVVGLRLSLVRRASAAGVKDVQLALVHGGSAITGSNRCCLGWVVADQAVTGFVGGASDLWGTSSGTLTPAVVNDPSFGISVRVQNTASTPVEAFLDEASFYVYYILDSVAATTSVATTAVATTAAATSSVPTTALPTTALPTTAVPTTDLASTAVPTTAASTAVPTTALPTTAPPTTAMPTTAAQSTTAEATTRLSAATTDLSAATTGLSAATTGLSAATTGLSAATAATPPAALMATRYCKLLQQTAEMHVSSWNLNRTSYESPGSLVPLTPTEDNSAKSKNGVFVYSSLPAGVKSTVLYITGYSNAVPSGATVVGVQFSIVRRASAPGLRDVRLALMHNGNLVGANRCPAATLDDSICPSAWIVKDPVQTIFVGGPTDLWGGAPGELTPAVVNHPTFGFSIRVENTASSPVEAFLDEVTLHMFYTVPSPPGSLVAKDELAAAEPAGSALPSLSSPAVTGFIVAAVVGVVVVAVAVVIVRRRWRTEPIEKPSSEPTPPWEDIVRNPLYLPSAEPAVLVDEGSDVVPQQ